MAKSSSSLILITVFAFISTESDQRNGDPADLVNFPGHVLEGTVCVNGYLHIRDLQKHNMQKSANR